MDAVELYLSHTPTEWLVQRVLAVVDPWGDERADKRAALNTMTAAGQFDMEVFRALTSYTDGSMKPEEVGPAAMRQALEG